MMSGSERDAVPGEPPAPVGASHAFPTPKSEIEKATPYIRLSMDDRR